MHTNYEKGDTFPPYEGTPRVRPSITYTRPIKKRRYSLVLPPRITPWAASISEALKHVFGYDDLGAQALALF